MKILIYIPWSGLFRCVFFFFFQQKPPYRLIREQVLLIHQQNGAERCFWQISVVLRQPAAPPLVALLGGTRALAGALPRGDRWPLWAFVPFFPAAISFQCNPGTRDAALARMALVSPSAVDAVLGAPSQRWRLRTPAVPCLGLLCAARLPEPSVREEPGNGLSTPCPANARAGRLLLFEKYVIK